MDPKNRSGRIKNSHMKQASSSETPNQQEGSREQIQNELEDFRERWQKELQISPKNRDKEVEKSKRQEDAGSPPDAESRAKALFLQGVDMEKNGKLYEAIQFYKKAIQLVPDIEFRLHANKDNVQSLNVDVDEENANVKESIIDDISSESDNETLKEGNLFCRVQKKMSKASSICRKKFDQNAPHISELPLEIILYILRWVVSSELDLRSLETFGRVCRGFYLCARDPEIWRLACRKVWGLRCGKTPGVYGSWRQMYVSRPRLRYEGCYISKTTYIRPGENSFQDQFCRPWHMVTYYRYFRFFPDGTVLMLTSADEPAQCVSLLRHKNVKAPVLTGYYRLKDDKVTLVVHKQDAGVVFQQQGNARRNNRRNNRETVEVSEQIFNMEMQIGGGKKQRHVQLLWTRYSVRSKGNVCVFDLVNNRFPSLWFSRVKSYTLESEHPLV